MEWPKPFDLLSLILQKPRKKTPYAGTTTLLRKNSEEKRRQCRSANPLLRPPDLGSGRPTYWSGHPTSVWVSQPRDLHKNMVHVSPRLSHPKQTSARVKPRKRRPPDLVTGSADLGFGLAGPLPSQTRIWRSGLHILLFVPLKFCVCFT